ncbi:MAG: putative F0F1-ATPase subunit Ca2+/Mg2+ transporter [Anaerosporomusa subterranea]|jgi:F0F1-type ATP synthase assembly protein I|nr:putative F0F1-ATPase subunit Ca2+/Mg2+ transporter [Anaerosporomusa subterranea]
MKNGMREVMAALSMAGTMGFAMAVNALVGGFLGRLIDGWLGTSPWGVAMGAGLGLAAGLRTLCRHVLDATNENNDEKDK